MRAIVGTLLLAFVCASCAPVHPGASGGAGNAWTVPGVVRLGEPDEPDNLNPLFGHTSATDQISGLLFAFLLRYDDRGNYIPDLALTVPSAANGGISRDGKTLVFHLRRGATWSDGAPLDARDWLFTYHAILNTANNVKNTFGWDDIASASAPDPYTLVVHLKNVNASVLGIFAMGGTGYPPLPAHLLAALPDINHADFNQHPISSGPYVLREWDHGSSLRFAPNPRYFRGAPKVEVLWKVIPDSNTMLAQLRTHEIDVYPYVDETSIARLASIDGIAVTKKLTANWRHLGINCARPALRDVRVRRAIAEAIDWKRLNDTIYHGYNTLATSDVFPESWAAPKIAPYRYDPAGARRLLRDAGVSHLDLTIISGNNKQENADAEIAMQAMLHNVGIKLSIRNYPVSLLFAQDGPIYSGSYDLEWSVDTNAPDPDNTGLWSSAYIPPHGGNTSWLRDAIVDRTSNAALRTFDIAARAALYQREEERLHDLVPAVFFYWENGYFATNRDLRNFKPAAFIADTWNSWEWEIGPSASPTP